MLNVACRVVRLRSELGAALAVARDRGCALVGGHARRRGDLGAAGMRFGGEDGRMESDQAKLSGGKRAHGGWPGGRRRTIR